MTRLRALALACALSVPAAVTADELVHFALSAEAERCCASTGGACAGLSSPDECCQTQDQAVNHGYTTVAPDSRVRVAPEPLLLGLVPIVTDTVPSIEYLSEDSRGRFTRPHDPPHLHPFPLLI